MVQNSCYVPGCNTGYQSDRRRRKKAGLKNLHLFSVPRDKEKFQKWKEVIPRAHRDLTENDKICELHFFVEEIEEFMTVTLPDGREERVKRKNCVLKPDAVPSTFPNVPKLYGKRKYITQGLLEPKKTKTDIVIKEEESSSSSVHQTNKEHTDFAKWTMIPTNEVQKCMDLEDFTQLKNEIPTEVEKCLVIVLPSNNVHNSEKKAYILKPDAVSCSYDSPSQAKKEIVLQKQKFSFSSLVQEINRIRKPSHWWSVSSHDDFIICAKWDAKCGSERQIIIDNNLNLKVLYYSKEASNISKNNVESAEDLSSFMKAVDAYSVCAGASSGKDDCCLYVTRWYLQEKRRLWCTACRKSRNKLPPDAKLAALKTRYTKWHEYFADVKQKNTRLKEKIIDLQEKIDALKDEYLSAFMLVTSE